MPPVLRHEPPAPGVTEIRVHGVGGGTPQSLLGQTGVYQVTGDETAGLFRGTVGPASRTVEAYSWGGLTAGDRNRAFWVLLLPFSLINLAGWMVEPAGEDPMRPPRAIRYHEAVVLWIGLVTTVLYVMWTAFVTMNVAAFQCGAVSQCIADRWYLRFFSNAFFRDHAGRRLLVGLLVPLALLGLFVLLGRISRTRYDDYGEEPGEAGAGAPFALGLEGFWFTSSWQADASRLHVAGALAVLGGLLARATAEFEARFGVGLSPNIGMWLFWAAVTIAVATVVTLAVAATRYRTLIGLGFELPGVSHTLVVLASAVLAVAAWLTWQMDVADSELVRAGPGGTSQPVTDLWGFGWAPLLLLAVAIGLVAAFSVIQLWRWISHGPLYFDQFAVPAMIVLVVYWGSAAPLAVVSLAVAALVQAVPRRRQGPRDAWRFWVFAGSLGIAFVTRLVSSGWPHPFGVEGSRLTPLLVFAVVLATLIGVRSRGNLASRLYPAGAAAAMVLLGWLFSVWWGTGEWLQVGAGLAFVVTMTIWAARFQHDDYQGFRWNGPGAVALFALSLIAGGFSGGVIRLVDLLDQGGAVFDLRATGIYEWITLGFAGTVGAALVGAAAWLGYVVVSRGGEIRRLAAARLEGLKKAAEPTAKLAAYRECFAEAVRGVDVELTVLGMLMLGGWLALIQRLTHLHGRSLEVWIDEGTPNSWGFVVDVASLAALGVALGAFLSIRRGLRDPEFRTRIGILWDVSSFWPRSFHPFAPPAYAARAVPELQARIAEIAESGGRTILSGHSQGSVVSLAAVASLPATVWPTVALVTHGSPLGRFYRTFFPRYFSDEFLRQCGEGLGCAGGAPRWVNFHRPTDPIADPVLRGAEDGTVRNVALDDPWEAAIQPFQPPPSVRGHGGYMADPRMADTVDALAESLLALPEGSRRATDRAWS